MPDIIEPVMEIVNHFLVIALVPLIYMISQLIRRVYSYVENLEEHTKLKTYTESAKFHLDMLDNIIESHSNYPTKESAKSSIDSVLSNQFKVVISHLVDADKYILSKLKNIELDKENVSKK